MRGGEGGVRDYPWGVFSHSEGHTRILVHLDDVVLEGDVRHRTHRRLADGHLAAEDSWSSCHRHQLASHPHRLLQYEYRRVHPATGSSLLHLVEGIEDLGVLHLDSVPDGRGCPLLRLDRPIGRPLQEASIGHDLCTSMHA